MEFLRGDLENDKHDQQREKQRGAEKVAPVHGHGDGIAAGLAQRRCGNFYDPENEGNFGNFARHLLQFHHTFLLCAFHSRSRLAMSAGLKWQ